MNTRWLCVVALLVCCSLARSQTCGDCGVGGTCMAGVCHCHSPYLGANCSLRGETMVLSPALSMDWMLSAEEGYLYVRLEAETTSWAAVMMAPDAHDGMSGGDCWRLSYDSAGVPRMDDMYSTGHSTPLMDTQQDLEDVVSFESVHTDGKRTLVSTFRRKLISDDGVHDKTIVQGPMLISWALGAGAPGSFLQHSKSPSRRAVVQVDFLRNEVHTWSTPKQYTLLAFGGWLLITMIVGALLFHNTRFRLSSLGRRLLHWHPFHKLDKYDAHRSVTRPRPFRLLASLTLGEVCVLGLYFIAWAVFMGTAVKTYRDANDTMVYVLGHLTAIHLALAFLPVSKNSLWMFVMGLPFERAIKWHRWVSRVCVLLCTVHGATMIDRSGWSYATKKSETREGYGNVYGALSWLFMMLMLITSFPRVRRYLHRLFFLTHQLLLVATFIMAMLHSKHAFYLSIGVVALWLIDHAYRFWTTQRSVQVLKAQIHRGVHTVVELTIKPNKHMRYEVGQYVYLCVSDIGMSDWHPFSISSCPSASAKSQTITLHLQAMPYRPYPIPLLDACISTPTITYAPSSSIVPSTSSSSSSSSTITSSQPKNWTQRMAQRVVQQPNDLQLQMDGPYGQIGVKVFDDYSHIILCAGGIGVTPLMSVLCELHQRRPSHVQSVWLLWSCRDVEAFQSWFSKQLGDIQQSGSSVFRLSFFLTSGNSQAAQQQVELKETAVHTPALPSPSPSAPASPSSSGFPTFHDSAEPSPTHQANSASSSSALSSSASTATPNAFRGRPVYSELFSQIKAESSKVCVLTCGPDPMMDEVQMAALSRNFHLHRETFAL